MVFAGNFLPASQAVADSLGVGTFGVNVLMFAQVFAGGILILYMDEVISKWGVGSGIGLFIIAGVSQSLMGGLISIPQLPGDTIGVIPGYIMMAFGLGDLSFQGIDTLLFGIAGGGQGASVAGLIAIATTIFIFVVVVYAESVRVEIPLSHARVKGARGRFPVKLIYASVLPMILVRALQANVQFVGQILNSQMSIPTWLGEFVEGQAVSGLFYYLRPIQSPGDWMWWLGTSQEPWQIMIRIGVDLTFMVIGGAIFAIFWVETTDMGPEATAKQIQNSGMQIPGFRQNPGVLEKVLERYIPQVTVIGGALVGLLAVMANMLGTIGGVSGTGLLLTVSITYKIYEEIAEEQLMEMHPMMRQMFG
jgi:preprotein translocase subunit SecY